MKLHVNSISTYVVLATVLLGTSPLFAATSNPTQAVFVGPPAPALPTIKSYREWKSTMISEAESRLKATKDSILSKTRAQLGETANSDLKTMHNKYDKESLQLSLAYDLTISDYFVGYLTKQKELDKAIKEVSSRLTDEEVAELMSAYANNFFSSKASETKQPPSAELRSSVNP